MGSAGQNMEVQIVIAAIISVISLMLYTVFQVYYRRLVSIIVSWLNGFQLVL